MIEDLIKLAIKEDMAKYDITTQNLIPKDLKGKGKIIAKESFTLAGLFLLEMVFKHFDKDVKIVSKFEDGDFIEKNTCVAEVFASLSCLLNGERIALNFLQRLSGIATNSKQYKDAIQDLDVKLTDTRKTTPGWRSLEKYAVKIGGCDNHRFSLFDGVLIKDNHIAASKGICDAVLKLRKNVHHLIKIEVECSTIEEVQEALNAKADVIMLDNMNIANIKKAVKIINKKALVEVSGNVSLSKLRDLAKTGVDIISVGALTHQAKCVDISMRVEAC